MLRNGINLLSILKSDSVNRGVASLYARTPVRTAEIWQVLSYSLIAFVKVTNRTGF